MQHVNDIQHPIFREVLQRMLVADIAGYKLQINEANTFSTKAFTFSEATKVFYNAEEQYIELNAGDYVANPDFFEVNLQRYNLAQGVEVQGVIDEKRSVADFFPSEAADAFSWSSFNKRKRIAWVYIGIDYRYFITIEATGQDGFLDLEAVRSWLDWGALFAQLGGNF